MILLVTADASIELPVEARESSRVRRCDSARNAVSLIADAAPDLVVVDRAVDDADNLVRSVCAGSVDHPGAPVVVLTDGDADELPLRGCDAVVRKPFNASAFRTAVDRSAQIGAYQHAVDTLYEQCRGRAADGTTDPFDETADLHAARSEADALLSDLVSLSEPLSELLPLPGDGEVESEE